MDISHSGRGTQALGRASAVLRCIASHGARGASLSELSHLLGMPHPTCHRLLEGLMQERLATQTPGSKRYRIGPFAFELGLIAVTPLDRLSAYAPTIETLARATGDTAYLMALQTSEIVCLLNHEGQHHIRTKIIEVGQRRPMCDSVAGIAILSSMSAADLQETLESSLSLPAVSTRLSRDEILQKAREASLQGMAHWRGIVIPGIAGAAVPVPGLPHSHLAVAMSTIESRLQASRLPEVRMALLAAADSVSRIYREASLNPPSNN